MGGRELHARGALIGAEAVAALATGLAIAARRAWRADFVAFMEELDDHHDQVALDALLNGTGKLLSEGPPTTSGASLVSRADSEPP